MPLWALSKVFPVGWVTGLTAALCTALAPWASRAWSTLREMNEDLRWEAYMCVPGKHVQELLTWKDGGFSKKWPACTLPAQHGELLGKVSRSPENVCGWDQVHRKLETGYFEEKVCWILSDIHIQKWKYSCFSLFVFWKIILSFFYLSCEKLFSWENVKSVHWQQSHIMGLRKHFGSPNCLWAVSMCGWGI